MVQSSADRTPSAAGASKALHCVEVYVPKRLDTLSALYTYLRGKLTQRKAGIAQDVPIDGFSLYEVDGAFYGKVIYEERTVVLRILFDRSRTDDSSSIESKINTLGSEVAATVAMTEEEIWICHYPLDVVIFRPGQPSENPG